MYGKFFESAYTGSMMGAGPDVFAVWGYIIAHTQTDSHVELNPKLISVQIGMSEDAVQRALDYLQAPDDRSRSKTEDGRRVKQIGAFLYEVVNHAKYRDARDEFDRRSYMRDYMKQKRRKHTKKGVLLNSVKLCKTPLTVLANTDTDTDTDTDKKNPLTPFEIFWKSYPKKKSRGQAERAWAKIKPSEQLLATMIATIERAKTSDDWQQDGGKYIPYPATWLNAKGWEDDTGPSSGNGHCVFDGKPMHKFQPDRKGQKVSLCRDCYDVFRRVKGGESWGNLPRTTLEQIITQGRF